MCSSASLRGLTRLSARSPHRQDTYEGLVLRHRKRAVASHALPELTGFPAAHTKHALSRRQHTVSSLLSGVPHGLQNSAFSLLLHDTLVRIAAWRF